MNRFNWSWVLGLAAAVGLLTCQNVAWGADFAEARPFLWRRALPPLLLAPCKAPARRAVSPRAIAAAVAESSMDCGS